MAVLRVGTSGYDYDDWKGRFYPADLSRGDRLSFYATHFRTVELNSTFYGLPDRQAVQRWRDAVPDGFRFSVKISRYGTHLKRLRDPGEWIERFAGALEPLGSSMGPVLVQLPPRWHRDPDRLAGFLEATPERWRIAVEIRDRDWLHRSVYEVLRAHGAALCIHDLLDRHPQKATADWMYMRFHGPDAGQPYTGSYTHQALSGAARRVRDHLGAGRDSYVYFNNDVGGNAVGNALDLKRYLDDGPSMALRDGWDTDIDLQGG